jgi:hypothetical protein
MKKLHIALMSLCGVVLLYIISYAALSLLGSPAASQSGKLKYMMGLSISDVEVWRPKFVYLKIYNGLDGKTQISANTLGWIFLPLEILDRRYWHPTKPLFKINDTEQDAAANP